MPLAVSVGYGDGSWSSFLLPAVAMTAVGGVSFRGTRPASRRSLAYVSPRDVLLSVTLAWVLSALLGGVRRVVLTVCMLLGRLEETTALALPSPAFWRR